MKVKLKNLAKISSGLFSRTHSGGDIFYLMARDFDKNFRLKTDVEPRISDSGKLPRHLLSEGDVLFAAKGHYFFAAVFDGEVSSAVASSVFLVLRLNNGIMPHFIAWYLNHPETQKLLWNLSTGSSIPSINKSSLAEVEIPIPDLEIQQKIVQFEKLRLKEKEIKRELNKLQEELLNYQLINIVN